MSSCCHTVDSEESTCFLESDGIVSFGCAQRQSRGVRVKGNIVVEHARYFKKTAEEEENDSSPAGSE